MFRQLNKFNLFRNINCRHKNTSLVVVEAFDMYEKLKLICTDCREELPLPNQNKISIKNGKLLYKKKAYKQLSHLEKLQLNIELKSLNMKTLQITPELAQALIESPKVLDFDLIFINKAADVVSSFKFKKEAKKVADYIQEFKPTTLKLNLKTKTKTVSYQVVLEQNNSQKVV